MSGTKQPLKDRLFLVTLNAPEPWMRDIANDALESIERLTYELGLLQGRCAALAFLHYGPTPAVETNEAGCKCQPGEKPRIHYIETDAGHIRVCQRCSHHWFVAKADELRFRGTLIVWDTLIIAPRKTL